MSKYIKLCATLLGLVLFLSPVFSLHASGSTLYFLGTEDGDWANINNWWEDESQSVQASNLPTISDSVYIESSVATNSGDPAEASSVSMYSGFDIGISLNVANYISFSGGSNTGVISAQSAQFDSNSYNGGTVNATSVSFLDSGLLGVGIMPVRLMVMQLLTAIPQILVLVLFMVTQLLIHQAYLVRQMTARWMGMLLLILAQQTIIL